MILNLNDLIKFALESITNYFGTLFMLGIIGTFTAAIIVHIAEKLGSVIITSIMVMKNKNLTENSKIDDDKD